MIERILLNITIACMIAACVMLGRALAEPDTVRDRLALEVAIVAAHEGALDNIRDTALVWQVVEARADNDRDRLRFLRAHSPRALGIKACSGGNCEWSVELLRNPHATPSSVDASYWSRVRAGTWTLVMRKAAGLVYGIDDDRPCAGSPYSWGCAGDVDSAWRQRGLIPMGCAGVLNDGFQRASKTLRAAVAKGERQ